MVCMQVAALSQAASLGPLTTHPSGSESPYCLCASVHFPTFGLPDSTSTILSQKVDPKQNSDNETPSVSSNPFISSHRCRCRFPRKDSNFDLHCSCFARSVLFPPTLGEPCSFWSLMWLLMLLFSNILKWYPLHFCLHPKPFRRWVVPLFVNTPARLPKHPSVPPNPVAKSTANDIPTSATLPIHPNPAAKYSHLCLFLQFFAPKGLLASLGLSSLLT